MSMPGNSATYESPQPGDAQPRALGDAYERLRLQLEERPYQTLAVVAGVGFVLGGGLFTRFAARVIASSLRVGLAAAFAPLVDSLVAHIQSPLESGNGHDAADR
jgi:hypothetical protein